MSRREGNDNRFSAPPCHFLRSNDGVDGVVTAFHNHVRTKGFHELERCVFFEENYQVNRFECRENVSPLTLHADGTFGSLETLHRCVGVDANNQRIAACSGRREKIDVPSMQQIENTVGENNATRDDGALGSRIVPGRRKLFRRLPHSAVNAEE